MWRHKACRGRCGELHARRRAAERPCGPFPKGRAGTQGPGAPWVSKARGDRGQPRVNTARTRQRARSFFERLSRNVKYVLSGRKRAPSPLTLGRRRRRRLTALSPSGLLRLQLAYATIIAFNGGKRQAGQAGGGVCVCMCVGVARLGAGGRAGGAQERAAAAAAAGTARAVRRWREVGAQGTRSNGQRSLVSGVRFLSRRGGRAAGRAMRAGRGNGATRRYRKRGEGASKFSQYSGRRPGRGGRSEGPGGARHRGSLPGDAGWRGAGLCRGAAGASPIGEPSKLSRRTGAPGERLVVRRALGLRGACGACGAGSGMPWSSGVAGGSP